MRGNVRNIFGKLKDPELARSATRWGAIACAIQAVRMSAGNILMLVAANKPLANAIAWFIGASLIPCVLILASCLFWKGRGAVLGSIALLIIVVDLIIYGQPASPNVPYNVIAALLVKAVILLLIVNGVRGAISLNSTP
jgi:hypothetical protein